MVRFSTPACRSPGLIGLRRVVERGTRTQSMYGRQQVCWNRLLLFSVVTVTNRWMVDPSCELGKQYGNHHDWHPCHCVRRVVCQRRARGDEVFRY